MPNPVNYFASLENASNHGIKDSAMKPIQKPSLSRNRLRAMLAAGTVGAFAVAAAGRSCIVDAGTESYAQASDHSAQTALDVARTVRVRATAVSVETRRRSSDASAGRRLLTTPAGGVFLFR